MIYHFPDLDSFRLAITSGTVPSEVSLAPAVAGQDDDGHIWLEPSVAVPRKAQNALRRLGVELVKANGDFQAEKVCCWLQLIPVVKGDTTVPSAQTPVLFELSHPAQLPVLVGEMLRLGNDRQGFRWLKDDSGERVLLRVIGPPYYSLLRALERNDAAAPRAYVERSPRVWVEVGQTHPEIERIRPKEGRFVLIRPPREWTFLEDAPFQDIYDILDFPLPDGGVSYQTAELKGRIQVPLRLAPGGTAEPAELWVVREEPIQQLDALVREADDHLLQQLAFAVAEQDGHTTIVLRARPSKQAPPALELKGQSFRPFLKLKNLFLPHGSRLQPPLRRDAVRRLLADDPDRVTWLWPGADGRFTPESLPENSFHPLRDWVEYILDREHQALADWIAATRFDFESFVCKDDHAPAAPKPPGPERKRAGKGKDAPAETELPAEAPTKAAKPRRKDTPQEFTSVQSSPGETEQRLRSLEKQFVDVGGPLDASERQALWPEMAELNAALGQAPDAAICWLNALWSADDPSPDWGHHWARTETKSSTADSMTRVLDRLLANPEPQSAEVRAVIACVVSAPERLGNRIVAVRHYLEKHEADAAVRAVWLAWLSLARLSAGDVLGLARARDRLLDRLLSQGMRPQHDLPTFLPFAGHGVGDRFRAVRDQLTHLRELAQLWIITSYDKMPDPKYQPVVDQTVAYADLIFAFGLARVGEGGESKRLEEEAKPALDNNDPIHSFLLQAFDYRIEQCLHGKPHIGALPTEYLEELNSLEDKRVIYKADRLRQHSRILEPQEKVKPFEKWHLRTDDLAGELLALVDVHDRDALSQRLGRLLQSARSTAYFRVLGRALDLAPRVGEAFTIDILNRFGPAFDQLPPPREQLDVEWRAEMLERALFLAAHYDRAEEVQAMVGRFLKLLQTQRGDQRHHALHSVVGQCFRGLRKVGLKDEIDQLLQEMANLVLQGQDLRTVQKRLGPHWPAGLQTLLQIAAGWFYFGREQKALPVLDAAAELLYGGTLLAPEQTRLACAYAAACAQAPTEIALKWLLQLFQKLPPTNDNYYTNTHYSLSQLQIIEAVVLAVVSDDFNLGQNVRRWLDEDEYLVRRRIHRDLRTVMAQAGM